MQTIQGSFRHGLRIQLRVIHALILRELLTRYGRHNLGFLWVFIEPMIFTLAVVTLWTITGMHHGSSIPIVAFGITGYSGILLWRNMPGRATGAIEPNFSLLTHRPVQVVDVFFARVSLEAIGATVSFVVLSIGAVSLNLMSTPEDLFTVLLAWALFAWFGFSIALLVGAWAESSHLVEKLWHPLAYIMIPISGAVYLVDALPPVAQELVLYLPMVHCMEMLRDGFFGSFFKAHYDVTYIVLCNTFISLFALAKIRELTRCGVYR